MRYYVDFDRTIFDTEGFSAYIEERERNTLFPGLSKEEMDATLEHMAQDGTLTFEPGELSQFLYPDAAQFLRDKENAVTIITYGSPAFQELKTKSALYGIPRMSVMYTGNSKKGTYLGPHTHLHADAAVVDDSVEELEILAKECPTMTLYEMRRDGTSGDGRWSVVRSFGEIS